MAGRYGPALELWPPVALMTSTWSPLLKREAGILVRTKEQDEEQYLHATPNLNLNPNPNPRREKKRSRSGGQRRRYGGSESVQGVTERVRTGGESGCGAVC